MNKLCWKVFSRSNWNITLNILLSKVWGKCSFLVSQTWVNFRRTSYCLGIHVQVHAIFQFLGILNTPKNSAELIWIRKKTLVFFSFILFLLNGESMKKKICPWPIPLGTNFLCSVCSSEEIKWNDLFYLLYIQSLTAKWNTFDNE